MSPTQVLFGFLFGIAILVLFGMNFTLLPSQKREGFQDSAAPAPAPSKSAIETKVRDVLDRITVPEICPLFNTIRDTMRKNEKAGQQISDEEVNRRVEKNLALKIPGGALPCPLLQYPRSGATDLDWLDFVNKIPDDYGARIVFMAMYAKDFLGQNAEDLKSALSGKPPESQGGGTEQFASICPPDVAASRREEALRKSKESCVLPETLSAEEIQEAITERLKVIVSTKTKSLQAKGINPTIDIIPIIKEAEKSAVYLNQKKMETEQGTLAPTAPAPGL